MIDLDRRCKHGRKLRDCLTCRRGCEMGLQRGTPLAPAERLEGLHLLKRLTAIRNALQDRREMWPKVRLYLERASAASSASAVAFAWNVIHGGFKYAGFRTHESAAHDIAAYVALRMNSILPVPAHNTPCPPSSLPTLTHPGLDMIEESRRIPHHPACKCPRCRGTTPHSPDCLCKGANCPRK